MMKENNARPVRASVPGWLLEAEDTEISTGRGSGVGFVRKTLASVSRTLQNDLLAERYAAGRGFLQGIDPRLKFLTLLFFMVTAGLAKSFLTLLLLCIVALMLAKLSRLGVLTFVRRVWLVIPLLLLVLSIPAATNLFIPGKPLIVILADQTASLWFLRFPHGLYFSQQGLSAVLKICTRVGVSISFGYLLVMTTRWLHITRSLRMLKVPRLVITILDMTYRYIFVLIQISIEIFEARLLRTVGRVGNKSNRKFVSGGIAFLFVKASHMSEEVHDAMLCRCYSGEPVGLEKFKFTRNNFVWLCNFIIIVFILLTFQR